MAQMSNCKVFAVYLLLIALTAIHADDTDKTEIDKEMFASRNQLLDSMFNESLKVGQYMFDRGGELCQKMLDDDTYNHTSSEALENVEKVLQHCVRHVVERLGPALRHREDNLDEVLLFKYGFEDIQKTVNQKFADLFKEVVRQIDVYVKGLTAEQQRKTTALNLKMWSSKIKSAPTLAWKDMTFNSCMRFYYFERGV